MRARRFAVVAVFSVVASASFAQDFSLPARARSLAETKTLRLAAIWGRYPLDRDEPKFRAVGASVSRDGRLAVVAAEPWDLYPQERGLRVYDLVAGNLVAHVGTALSPPTSVIFLPDGGRVVSGHKDGKVRVIAVPSGEVQHVLEAHKGEARVALADGAIVTAGDDGVVKEWDTESFALSRTVFTDEKLGIELIAAHGALVAIGLGWSVAVLDRRTGELSMIEAGDDGAFRALAFSADGKLLAVGRSSPHVELHDLGEKKRLWRAKVSGKVGPTTLAFAPDGRHLVAGSGGAPLHVIETERGAVVSVLSGRFTTQAAFTPDGATVLATGASVELVDFAKRRTLRERDGHAERVVGLAASRDGARAVSASWDGTLKVWEKGRVARTLIWPGVPAERIALTADGQLVAAARGRDMRVDGVEDRPEREDTVAFFDLARGVAIAPVTSLEGRVEGIALSSDAEVAVTVGDEVHRWDLPAASAQKLPGRASAVAVSPDGAKLLQGAEDGTLELRATKRGGTLARTKAHEGAVRALAFSPDGTRALSAGSDGTVQLHVIGKDRAASWDRRWSVRAMADAEDVTVEIAAVSFSPDGERVLVLARRVELRDARSGALLDAIDLSSSGDEALAATFLGRDVLVGTRQGVVLRFAPK
ncbi:MAG: WD40 repeat domain-containing protein [Planctomycetota bacterium]